MMKNTSINVGFSIFLFSIASCYSSEVEALNRSYKILIVECKVSDDSSKSFLSINNQKIMATKKISFEVVKYISPDSQELVRLVRAGKGGKQIYSAFFKFHLVADQEIYPNLRVFGGDNDSVNKVHLLVLALSPVPSDVPFLVVGSPTKADVDLFIQNSSSQPQ